jgi:bifunctional non-homologous end joining protein LigD
MIHRMDPAEDPDREPMPEKIVPMLAKIADLPSDPERWAFEVKWDGVRALAYSEPGRLRFEARTGNDITKRYPELHRLNRALSSHSAILDGEIVAFDETGRPSFGRLQHRMHIASEAQAKRLSKDSPVVYVIFDVLWLDGHSVMGLPYTDRRELLGRLDLKGTNWQVPDHVVGDGADLQEATRAQGLEGIVAKRLDSPYEPGRRSVCWRKITCATPGAWARASPTASSSACRA